MTLSRPSSRASARRDHDVAPGGLERQEGHPSGDEQNLGLTWTARFGDERGLSGTEVREKAAHVGAEDAEDADAPGFELETESPT
jgi:hypothetical protein